MMERGKYQMEEKEGIGMVQEPTPAYHSAIAEATPVAWDDNNATFSDSYPLGRSLEEVREHCSHFEEERNDPTKWMSIEQFNQHLHERHPWWRL